jgi:hypothetical protein
VKCRPVEISDVSEVLATSTNRAMSKPREEQVFHAGGLITALMMEARIISETSTRLHDATTQKTATFIAARVRI